LALCAAALFAPAVPSFGIKCEVFLIPPEFHSGSGYTALECGRDGKVYVGTAWYGGSAHLIRFDPRTKRWEKIFDAHAITREPITALDAQGKIHAKILVDADGIIWAATKHGNEAWEERPEYGEDATGYPGGHLFSYNPKTRQTIDHGILMKQNGIMGGAIDNARRRLYYVSDAKAHFLIYDIDRNTVRNLGYVGGIPRYMTIDRHGRVFIEGGTPNAPFGWLPTGAKTPYLCMYDPDTDRLYQLAVTVEGPGADEYMAPYVLVAGVDVERLFANAVGGKYLMEFDLNSISLDRNNPMANGSIVCRHVSEVTPAGNQRAGVVGKDGCYYFANTRLLFRYDPVRRTLENLGEIEDPSFGPNVYPQGAAVGPDGTLYLKHLFPYRIIRFPQLTAPRGAR
jgi:sugar lactone lactonase YvrE